MRTIYKLITVANPAVIQGLISLENRGDHFYMHLIESSPANLGRSKAYLGVAGNLVAFACKLAFESGHEGHVAFVSKTSLIDHYVATLGAKRAGGHALIIDAAAAAQLTSKYFSK